MMVSVTVSNNLDRVSLPPISDEKTPREAFELAHIEYESGTPTIDGSPLRAGDLDKSFAELGITNKCFLRSVVKADNA